MHRDEQGGVPALAEQPARAALHSAQVQLDRHVDEGYGKAGVGIERRAEVPRRHTDVVLVGGQADLLVRLEAPKRSLPHARASWPEIQACEACPISEHAVVVAAEKHRVGPRYGSGPRSPSSSRRTVWPISARAPPGPRPARRPSPPRRARRAARGRAPSRAAAPSARRPSRAAAPLEQPERVVGVGRPPHVPAEHRGPVDEHDPLHLRRRATRRGTRRPRARAPPTDRPSSRAAAITRWAVVSALTWTSTAGTGPPCRRGSGDTARRG